MGFPSSRRSSKFNSLDCRSIKGMLGENSRIFAQRLRYQVLQRFLLRLKFEDAVKFLKSLKNSGDCDETEIGRMLVLQAEKVEIPLEMIEVNHFLLYFLRVARNLFLYSI